MYLQDLIRSEAVVTDLMQIGQFHDLYFAGGFVRDGLMGKRTHDLDLATRGLLEDVYEYLTRQGYPSYFQPTFHALHTVIEGYRLTFTHLRKDCPQGRVEKATLAEDALRRDLTVNALYFQVLPTGELLLIDRVGGLNDLENKILRPVNPKTFFDDTSRLVRALRYRYRLGFSFAKPFLKDLRSRQVSTATMARDIGRVYAEVKRSDLESLLMAINDLAIASCWPLGVAGPGRDEISYFLSKIGVLPEDPLLMGITDDAFQSAKKKYLNFLARYSTLDKEPGPSWIPLFESLTEEEVQRYRLLFTEGPLTEYLLVRSRLGALTGQHLLDRGMKEGSLLGQLLEKARTQLLIDPTLSNEAAIRRAEEELF